MQHIKSLLQAKDKPVKWLFYGDSITHGAYHTLGWRDYTELFTERVRFELGRTMDIVIKTAISGNTTRDLLRSFDWRVSQFKPDVVFLMVGMNDCSAGRKLPIDEFEKNLVTLAEQIAALPCHLVMQTTNPILPGTAPDREVNYDAYIQKIRDVAAARNLPLIDHTDYWRKNKGSFYYWMSDAFHPNEYGHRAFARLLYESLEIWDPTKTCCKLLIP